MGVGDANEPCREEAEEEQEEEAECWTVVVVE